MYVYLIFYSANKTIEMHLHFLSMSLLTNKMSNLTENAKVLIISKLEETSNVLFVVLL
jgi:hypothetical protein